MRVAAACCAAALLTTSLAAPRLNAFQPAPAKPAPAAKPRVAAAQVGDTVIYTDQVQSAVAKATNNRPVTPDALASLQAQALRQLVRQQQIYEYLKDQEEFAASPLEISAGEQKLRARLQRQKLTLEQYLQKTGTPREALLNQLAGQIRWNNYLKSAVNDERLQACFEEHRNQYDGTQVRVRHILIRVGEEPRTGNVQAATRKALEVRKEITAEKLSFEDAARKYSAGPSRRQGGDLGFIPRTGLMVEAFSSAAFALKPDEISQPVVTPFGVHLIQCTEIKPGEKKLADVRAQVQARVAQEVFAELSAKLARKVPVRFTGATAYFLPGTGQLVMPNK